MGAGVYGSNFKGTGSSFLVSSDSYVTEDEYLDNYLSGMPEEEREKTIARPGCIRPFWTPRFGLHYEQTNQAQSLYF